jgi:hypothetical protein
MSACSLASRKISFATMASRPRGARIKTRSERGLTDCLTLFFPQQWLTAADIGRNAAQDALKFLQCRSDFDAAAADAEFADSVLVRSGSFLDRRDRPPHAAQGLEIA